MNQAIHQADPKLDHAEARDRHAAMGFQEGWGKALDQLVAYMKQL